MLYGSVIGGPMLYKMPAYRSSKIFVTGLFWRLRNHTFDGHRDNLKPLLPTKSPMPYRLVPLPSRSRDQTTSGLAFLAFRSGGLSNRIKRLRFIGFCRRYIPGAGGPYESENISGCVARKITRISGIVAGDEPGPWTEDFRYLTKGN